VIHLAAKKQARESMRKPLEYWDENVGSTLSLLRAIRNSEVRTILFSSSCSVYGNSGLTTLKTEFSPQSVYARTKLTSEQILIDCMHELGYRVGILRYFNVIGAGNFYNSGDRASEAVIPNFIKNVLENEPIKIFGNQYNTIDGTAVRDYVDVRDLSEAHIKVAQFLNQGDESQFECLVSTGNPKSVLEVATEVMMQIGKKVDITYVDSSSCDPAEVWSQVDVQLFNLGWVPNHNFRESVKSQILQSNGYLNTGKDVRE
jgi:UDP-glucose 4-epimerase